MLIVHNFVLLAIVYLSNRRTRSIPGAATVLQLVLAAILLRPTICRRDWATPVKLSGTSGVIFLAKAESR